MWPRKKSRKPGRVVLRLLPKWWGRLSQSTMAKDLSRFMLPKTWWDTSWANFLRLAILKGTRLKRPRKWPGNKPALKGLNHGEEGNWKIFEGLTPQGAFGH